MLVANCRETDLGNIISQRKSGLIVKPLRVPVQQTYRHWVFQFTWWRCPVTAYLSVDSFQHIMNTSVCNALKLHSFPTLLATDTRIRSPCCVYSLFQEQIKTQRISEDMSNFSPASHEISATQREILKHCTRTLLMSIASVSRFTAHLWHISRSVCSYRQQTLTTFVIDLHYVCYKQINTWY